MIEEGKFAKPVSKKVQKQNEEGGREEKKVKKISPSFSAWVTGKKVLLRERTGKVFSLLGLRGHSG